MPIKPLHPCKVPGCPGLSSTGYCEEHQAKRPVQDGRGSATARGYGYRWQKLRGMVLRGTPLCADPYGVHDERGEVVKASDVHHVVARREGGGDSMDNLEALCHACHSRITAEEQGGEGGWNT